MTDIQAQRTMRRHLTELVALRKRIVTDDPKHPAVARLTARIEEAKRGLRNL